jgi:hypothetical protein
MISAASCVAFLSMGAGAPEGHLPPPNSEIERAEPAQPGLELVHGEELRPCGYSPEACKNLFLYDHMLLSGPDSLIISTPWPHA